MAKMMIRLLLLIIAVLAGVLGIILGRVKPDIAVLVIGFIAGALD